VEAVFGLGATSHAKKVKKRKYFPEGGCNAYFLWPVAEAVLDL
jgi:hypothetical protein